MCPANTHFCALINSSQEVWLAGWWHNWVSSLLQWLSRTWIQTVLGGISWSRVTFLGLISDFHLDWWIDSQSEFYDFFDVLYFSVKRLHLWLQRDDNLEMHISLMLKGSQEWERSGLVCKREPSESWPGSLLEGQLYWVSFCSVCITLVHLDEHLVGFSY